jgi:hypothetical protein
VENKAGNGEFIPSRFFRDHHTPALPLPRPPTTVTNTSKKILEYLQKMVRISDQDQKSQK